MIAVADTTPICYLILIDEINLLAELFGTVLIPEAVVEELRHPGAPAPIAELLASLPSWLEVHSVGGREPPPETLPLDEGERAAILLARHLNADLLILDDKAGRQVAEGLDLRVTGTLGILEAAARRGLIDLTTAVERLRRTNFRVSPALLTRLLERNR